MKCEFCGANIDIESPVCPHCGMQKQQFEQHRSDMNRFQYEFQTVKEGVVEENKRFSKNASYITAICVLLILNLVLIVGHFMNWDIYKYIRAKDINKHMNEHIQMLEQYEEAGEFEALYSYYQRNDLQYCDEDSPLEEYRLMQRFCSNYDYVLRYLPQVSIKGYAPDSSYRVETQMETIVESYNSMVKLYNDYVLDDQYHSSYSERCFLQKHIDSYEAMIKNTEYFLMTYCEWDEEQLEEFKTGSKAKQILMIEEAYEKEGISHEEE